MLAAYAETCSVSRAAEVAGVGRRTHYDWLNADEKYRCAFEQIQDQAAQTLEDEAVRRAHEGVERPMTIAGKREVVRDYSDTLLIFLLKGLKPERYKERVAGDSNVKPAANLEIRELLGILNDELRDHPEMRYKIAQRLHMAEKESAKVQ